MSNTALAYKEDDAQEKTEIVLPLSGRYPRPVKIVENGKIVDTYRFVKTKRGGFMLQK